MEPTDAPADLLAPPTAWLSYLLRHASRLAQDEVAVGLAALGLRRPHSAVLALLADMPRSQAALSAQLQTDRTTMVALIDDLEGWQLVERRPNPSDRRAHQVTLTQGGAARLAAAQAARAAAEDSFFAPLSDRERAELRAMLLRLLAAHDG
jgi:DNA-binding MarR family transcriptional regulator